MAAPRITVGEIGELAGALRPLASQVNAHPELATHPEDVFTPIVHVYRVAIHDAAEELNGRENYPMHGSRAQRMGSRRSGWHPLLRSNGAVLISGDDDEIELEIFYDREPYANMSDKPDEHSRRVGTVVVTSRAMAQMRGIADYARRQGFKHVDRSLDPVTLLTMADQDPMARAQLDRIVRSRGVADSGTIMVREPSKWDDLQVAADAMLSATWDDLPIEKHRSESVPWFSASWTSPVDLRFTTSTDSRRVFLHQDRRYHRWMTTGVFLPDKNLGATFGQGKDALDALHDLGTRLNEAARMYSGGVKDPGEKRFTVKKHKASGRYVIWDSRRDEPTGTHDMRLEQARELAEIMNRHEEQQSAERKEPPEEVRDPGEARIVGMGGEMYLDERDRHLAEELEKRGAFRRTDFEKNGPRWRVDFKRNPNSYWETLQTFTDGGRAADYMLERDNGSVHAVRLVDQQTGDEIDPMNGGSTGFKAAKVVTFEPTDDAMKAFPGRTAEMWIEMGDRALADADRLQSSVRDPGEDPPPEVQAALDEITRRVAAGASHVHDSGCGCAHDPGKKRSGRYSRSAELWIARKIRFLVKREGKPLDQAIAMAMSMAREKGLKVPARAKPKRGKAKK